MAELHPVRSKSLLNLSMIGRGFKRNMRNKVQHIQLTEKDVKRQIKDYLNALGIFYFCPLQGLGATLEIGDKEEIISLATERPL